MFSFTQYKRVKFFIPFFIFSIAVTQNNDRVSRHLEPLEMRLELEASDSLLFGSEADVSFGIADIKYSDNALKILEFGEGPRSKFEGYDQLHGSGAMWRQVWDWLFTLHNNVFYIDPYMVNKAEEVRIDLDYFKSKGGHVAKNVLHLTRSSAFRRARNNYFKKTQRIKNYGGILIFRHQNASSDMIQAFKKQFPEFIIFDDSIAPFANNKYKLNCLFSGDEKLQKFRPHAKRYDAKYSIDLADQILADFKEDILVIKPLNACKGNGIIMTHRNDLHETLRSIFTIQEAEEVNEDSSFSFWSTAKNNHFLIESYEPSRMLTMEDKTYDATLRIVYALALDNGVMSIKILDGYWKLPFKAQEENGSLTEKAKSKINTSRQSSVILAEDDRKAVANIFFEFMPHLYKKMVLEHTNFRDIASYPARDLFFHFVAEEILASRTVWKNHKNF